MFSRPRQATGTLHTLGHSLGHSLKNAQTEKWAILARVGPFCLRSPKFRDFSRNVKNGEMAKKCEKPDRASGRNTLFYWKKQLCPKIHNVSYRSRPNFWHFWPFWPFFQKKTKFCTEARQHDHPPGSAFFKLCPKLCPRIHNGPGGRGTRSCGHPIIKKHQPTTTRCNRDGITPKFCRAFG